MTDLAGKKRTKTTYDPDLKAAVLEDVRRTTIAAAAENCGTCGDDCSCALNEVCHDNECCAPDCDGKECGNDGCSGSCGSCSDGEICTGEGLCCTPDCGGKACGDDGCGGSCEDCGEGMECSNGYCLSDGFAFVPAGSFWMGSPEGCPGPPGYDGDCTSELGRYSNETLHKVTLTQDFEMQVHEVTQGEWKTAFGGWNPSSFTGCGDNCPVEQVSWFDSCAYANWRSEQALLTPCYVFSGVKCEDGLDVGSNYKGCLNGTQKGIDSGTVTLADGASKPYACTGFRLPTESEWEYAARAGSQTAFYPSPGNDGSITQTGYTPLDPNLDQIGWYYGNSPSGTKVVGGKAANNWTQKDMSGNVREWCSDWYGTYPGGTQAVPDEDPYGSGGSVRVTRGGGWNYYAEDCRSAARYHYSPGSRYLTLGFRLARSL